MDCTESVGAGVAEELTAVTNVGSIKKRRWQGGRCCEHQRVSEHQTSDPRRTGKIPMGRAVTFLSPSS